MGEKAAIAAKEESTKAAEIDSACKGGMRCQVLKGRINRFEGYDSWSKCYFAGRMGSN